MQRYYYADSITRFQSTPDEQILGALSKHHHHDLEALQKGAWLAQIKILKTQLIGFPDGHIFFEFAIPRMGKRVDNIIIVGDTVFVVEFKVGASFYDKHAIEQTIDYTLDLANFHETSHEIKLVPILVATNAQPEEETCVSILELRTVAKANQSNLGRVIASIVGSDNVIDPIIWTYGRYKPTPTIIEAAQALYQGHQVEDISRSDAGTINLSRTSSCLNDIIESAKLDQKKVICFVTGVPGAGKTLAGLNVANDRMKAQEDEHAVFLSGNGPLVIVLREALTRYELQQAKKEKRKLNKKDAERHTHAFIQPIHHFRDHYLASLEIPIEKVVVFDEAQRAWTKEQASKFMRQKRGLDDFDMSEPSFLINVMDRHPDWCVIIGLIGGGQEINTGEAGLEEWISALRELYPDWEIHYSQQIEKNPDYLKNQSTLTWLNQVANPEHDLHLSVSTRSFRSENLSHFVHCLLELDIEKATSTLQDIKNDYPIVLTRDLAKAKNWVKEKARGTERYGIIASSGARRLRPFGIDVKNQLDPALWFLNDNEDVRSSFFMEDVATEFDIQGLEIDWALMAWGGNFHFHDNGWKYLNFSGTKWQNIHQKVDQQYLKNAYRVLLTRARQGMILFIPKGDQDDPSRPNEYYEGTYQLLKGIGIDEI
jgi:hypothetical protein